MKQKVLLQLFFAAFVQKNFTSVKSDSNKMCKIIAFLKYPFISNQTQPALQYKLEEFIATCKNHLLFWFYLKALVGYENLAFLNETEMVRNRQFAYQLGNTFSNAACMNLFLQVIVHCLRYNFILKIYTITVATLTLPKSCSATEVVCLEK